MSLLTRDIQKQLREAFAGLSAPVRLILFTQGGPAVLECEFCAEARQLAEEVAALSDQIALEVREITLPDGSASAAREFDVDKIPALVIMRGGDQPKDYGIRLYGLPSGYEFATLIEDIKLVSQGDSGLSRETLHALEHLNAPVHIQVYVTPTCPYCPRAVILAHRLALASDHITADMVEATEFPHLANRYHVYGVPRTIINEVIHLEGAQPEQALVRELLRALEAPTPTQRN